MSCKLPKHTIIYTVTAGIYLQFYIYLTSVTFYVKLSENSQDTLTPELAS